MPKDFTAPQIDKCAHWVSQVTAPWGWFILGVMTRVAVASRALSVRRLRVFPTATRPRCAPLKSYERTPDRPPAESSAKESVWQGRPNRGHGKELHPGTVLLGWSWMAFVHLQGHCCGVSGRRFVEQGCVCLGLFRQGRSPRVSLREVVDVVVGSCQGRA